MQRGNVHCGCHVFGLRRGLSRISHLKGEARPAEMALVCSCRDAEVSSHLPDAFRLHASLGAFCPSEEILDMFYRP